MSELNGYRFLANRIPLDARISHEQQLHAQQIYKRLIVLLGSMDVASRTTRIAEAFVLQQKLALWARYGYVYNEMVGSDPDSPKYSDATEFSSDYAQAEEILDDAGLKV